MELFVPIEQLFEHAQKVTGKSPPSFCVIGQCKVPSITNGSVIGVSVGSYVDHGSQLHAECNTGYEIKTEEAPKCYNGTWDYMPECIPGRY